jgi:TatD DNase family protein
MSRRTFVGDDKRALPPIPEPLAAPIVDAHTHLDAAGARTAQDVTAMVDRAASAGVAAVVTVADDLASARWVVQAADWDPRVWAAVALHPTRAHDLTDEARDELARLATHPRVVAVGETGLDYYWTTEATDTTARPDVQREAFRWHIDLAKRLDKPLMIHDRDAHEDILDVLEREGAPATVIFHCFSGDAAMARRAVDAGYLLSFAGPVTFKNAKPLQEAARLVPDTQLLVETDAPFLTPHPFRGRPNEPYCAAYTLRGLAQLRDVPERELAETVGKNSRHAFGLVVHPEW